MDESPYTCEYTFEGEQCWFDGEWGVNYKLIVCDRHLVWGCSEHAGEEAIKVTHLPSII